MTRVAVAVLVLGVWLAVRVRAPALRYRLPVIAMSTWRFAVPVAALALAASARPGAALGLGLLFLTARHVAARALGTMRREVAVQAELCRQGFRAGGEQATWVDIATGVLLERYERHGMARAEAVVLGARCGTLDDLVAQCALRQGGMSAYASYLRRFGTTGEVADAEAAIAGDRFPGGAPSVPGEDHVHD